MLHNKWERERERLSIYVYIVYVSVRFCVPYHVKTSITFYRLSYDKIFFLFYFFISLYLFLLYLMHSWIDDKILEFVYIYVFMRVRKGRENENLHEFHPPIRKENWIFIYGTFTSKWDD